MAKFNLAQFVRSARKTIAKHSPEILTGIGLVGMGVTVVLTAKGTVKAVKILESERSYNDSLTKVEVVKKTWKCYIPAAATGITSMACLVGASSANARRNAALATAYNISKATLSEYKDKVIETIGEKKEKEIKENIAQDKLNKNPISNSKVVVTEKGNTLCYDGVFGRYFMSDKYAIKDAMNNINRQIVNDMYASLNDFYDELGLPPVDIGYDLGWNIDDKRLDVEFDYGRADNDDPCLVIGFNVAPKYNYNKLF